MDAVYVFILIILAISPVSTSGTNCLIWTISSKKTTSSMSLDLVYSFNGGHAVFLSFLEFHIVDNNFISIGTCSYQICHLNNKQDGYLFTKNQYTFTIHRDETSDFDGTWQIVYTSLRHFRAQTYISYKTGTKKSTDVRIKAELFKDKNTNKTRIKLICSSCWLPRWHQAEFLINNISENTVSYDPRSNTCHSSEGECHREQCSCLNGGREFMGVFEHNENNKFYSCMMWFEDNLTDSKFSKTASLDVTESGGVASLTTTKLIGHTDHYTQPHDSTDSIYDLVPSTETPHKPSKDITVIVAVTVSALFSTVFAFLILCIKYMANNFRKAYRIVR